MIVEGGHINSYILNKDAYLTIKSTAKDYILLNI